MNDDLDVAVRALKQIHWLAKVGNAPEKGGEYLWAETPSAARHSLASPAWVNFKLMVRNRNYRDVARGNHTRFKKWDQFAQHAWGEVSAISDNIRRELTHRLDPPSSVLKNVDADVWAMLFELVYADLCLTPVWQSRLIPAFKRGHIPCGWVGDEIDETWAGASELPLPQGRVLIY